jgi:hypothetical protein
VSIDLQRCSNVGMPHLLLPHGDRNEVLWDRELTAVPSFVHAELALDSKLVMASEITRLSTVAALGVFRNITKQSRDQFVESGPEIFGLDVSVSSQRCSYV